MATALKTNTTVTSSRPIPTKKAKVIKPSELDSMFIYVLAVGLRVLVVTANSNAEKRIQAAITSVSISAKRAR